MSFLTIKNIGPLSDTGRIEITPLTLIIGKQSTGKSTMLKILCYCSWVEKHILLDDDKFYYEYTHYQKFLKELKKFHRLSDDEFSQNSYIEYESQYIRLELIGNRRNVKVTKKTQKNALFRNFKQCYVPAERNFLSSVQNIEKIYRATSIDNLFNFILEWREAKTLFSSEKPLDVVVTQGMRFFYDKGADKEILVLKNNKPIPPFYASSGVQSALPILVMANYLYQLIGKTNYSVSEYAENKNIETLTYQCFKLFIEEPEQNLFPSSQYDLILSLAKLIKENQSEIIITSHSPYILTTINCLIQTSLAYEKNAHKTSDVVEKDLCISPSSYSAYYISEEGTVLSLIDDETSLIKGEFLDAISESIEDMTYKLNTIIYGDD